MYGREDRPGAFPDDGDNYANAAGPASPFSVFNVSRFLFASTAFFVALLTRMRHQLARLGSSLPSLPKAFSSQSDVFFFFLLLSVWLALCLACTMDEPLSQLTPASAAASAVGLPVAAVVASLERARHAMYALPELLLPSPPPPPRTQAGIDEDALVERLISHDHFQSLLRRLAEQQVAEVRRNVMAMADEKMAEIRREVSQAEDGWAGRLDERVRQWQAEVDARLQQGAEASAAAAAASFEQTRREWRTEAELLEAAQHELEEQLQQQSHQSQSHGSSIMSENVESVRTHMNKLEQSQQALLRDLNRCCRTDDELQRLTLETVDSWLRNVTNSQLEDSEVDGSAKVFGDWLTNSFVSQSEAETARRALREDMRRELEDKMREDKDKASSADELLSSLTAQAAAQLQHQSHGVGVAHTKQEISRIVGDAIKIYDADKTGMFDFALESAGGTIVSTRCTETHDVTKAVYSVFGLPIWWERNNPRTLLQQGASPGQCWAFKGSHGGVLIRLSSRVRVSAVTLEHIPKMAAPDRNISSAPRAFAVYALSSPDDRWPMSLGNFTYLDNGEPVQTFPLPDHVTNAIDPASLIELRILSNHGNHVYTCVYRFRVHGTMVEEKEQAL